MPLAIVHLFSVGHIYHSNTNNLANISLRQVYTLRMRSARDFAPHVTARASSAYGGARSKSAGLHKPQGTAAFFIFPRVLAGECLLGQRA